MTVKDLYTRPIAGSAALVLIDMQRDFYADDSPTRIAGTRAAIPAMAKLAKAFREFRLPIVHVVRLYRPDGSNVDLVRRHSVEQGARIAAPGSICVNLAAIQLFSRAVTSQLPTDVDLPGLGTRLQNCHGVRRDIWLVHRGIDECRAIGVHVQDLSETLDCWLEGSCRAGLHVSPSGARTRIADAIGLYHRGHAGGDDKRPDHRAWRI